MPRNMVFSSKSHISHIYRQKVVCKTHYSTIDCIPSKSETENWTEIKFFKDSKFLKSKTQSNFCFHLVCVWVLDISSHAMATRKVTLYQFRSCEQNFQPSVWLDSAFPSVFTRHSKHTHQPQSSLKTPK